MPDILSTDILFLASERMTQNSDGGGRITADVVLDGEENGIFPDIASGDRIAGRTFIAKVYPAVRSPNDALYLASRVFLTEPPLDEKVSLALFTTGSWTDERQQLADYVEAYVTAGPPSEMKLLGDHVAGQQLIFCYQRLAAALPEVGDVFVISEETGGAVIAEEYTRVTKIDHEEVTYVDSQGEFQARRMELTISDPLTRRYPGGVTSRLSSYTPPTLIRATSPADAARFKGIAALTVAAEPGDLTINVASIYTRIVPATQAETAVLDATPTSATLTVSGGTRSVEIPQIAETLSIPVTINNRGFNYTFACNPLPAPLTLVVSYRAIGKWYVISDTAGDGTLSGIGTGAGVVNLTTGSGSVTLAALPDVGSAIVVSWGTPVHYLTLAGLQASAKPPHIAYTVEHPRIKPSTLTVQYVSGGVTKTATEAGAGTFAGDGSGPIDYNSGRIFLTPSAMPDANSNAIVAYTEQAIVTGSLIVTPTVRTFVLNLPVAGDTVKPGSVTVEFAAVFVGPQGKLTHETATVTDDGLGELVGELVQTGSSIDYATGAMTLVVKETVDREAFYHGWAAGWWATYPFSFPIETTTFAYTFSKTLAAETVHSETLTLAAMTIDLSPLTTDAIIPNSLQWTWSGRTYYDQDGSIYYGVNTLAGSINYSTQIMTITDWPNSAGGIVLSSGLASRGLNTVIKATFRAPGSPLRPLSVQLAATTHNGDLLTAVVNSDGDFVGDFISGTVDYEFGLFDTRFGAMVLDSSLTADEKLEAWYDPADIVGGSIFKPQPVVPSTIRFNCVLYSYLPLPAALLGLNPVRLPMDGRVPFCRPGDSAVVHYTDSLELPNPAVAAAEYDLGQTALARVWVKDATGQTVAGGIGGKYSADLDTGILTMATSLDLTDYTQPLTAYHMIANEAIIVDVDVSGQVRLAYAVQQDFPLGSYLSTSVRIGDMGARVTTPFSQQSWTSVWSDSRIGNVISPQFSHSIYPIVVTNDGAAQERWRVQFTASTTVDVIGETLGVIATGLSILSDIAPNNPVTGNPYFTIPYQGWGAGWISGYLLRFNTLAADYPLAVLRCVQQGPAGASADRLGIEFLGDVDA
jgi:hypothetical protein